MLHIETFPFNPFEENTYLIINQKKECWIVDPGMYNAPEREQFQNHLRTAGLVPQGIINTHAHIDHIFGIPFLMAEYKLPFSLHEREIPLLEAAPQIAQAYGLASQSYPSPTHILNDQTVYLDLGEDRLECRQTPGHSPGSISFYYAPGDWVLSGDALFAGSIGRTDLPGGDHNQLIESIKTQLLTLPEQTRVYPGHGPSTQIGQETRTNPFLQD